MAERYRKQFILGGTSMQIYYFSRTGRSKAIAEQLASRYHTTARMIDDHKNWNGKVNYMKAGCRRGTG